MAIVCKIVVIITGIVMLVFNLRNISKKKMDIGIGSWWTIMAVIAIVFGAVFDFALLLHLVQIRNLALMYLLVISLVIALYIYGMYITELKKKNDELAMWVSYAKSLRDDRLSTDDEGGAADPAKKKQTVRHAGKQTNKPGARRPVKNEEKSSGKPAGKHFEKNS